jgi:hypothetical protein
MPTPFMHMAFAQRLMADPVLPGEVRNLLDSAWGTFLLGNIAPDARVSSGISRADTHFFEYGPVIDPSPGTAMLTRHIDLHRAAINNREKIAFVAGYLAHLAMDEVWCTDLLFPCFIQKPRWESQPVSIFMLHILLGYLDECDRQKLPDSDYDPLQTATPNAWLPFMSDEALVGWRDLIATQLAPGAESQTFEIFGKRIGLTAAEIAEFIHDETRMNSGLWEKLSPQQVELVGEAMYEAGRRAVLNYFAAE